MNRINIHLLTMTAACCLLSPPAFAQGKETRPVPPAATARRSPGPPVDFGSLSRALDRFAAEKKPVGDVVAQLSKETGLLVIADNSVATTPISFAVQSLTLTQIVEGIARMVPGTVVRLVAIDSEITAPDPDLLAQMLRLGDALQALKPARKADNGPLTFTEIEIGGRRVPLKSAEPVLTTLEMRPVLLLTNPFSDNPVAKSARLQAESLQAYLAMTPEQRQQAAERQMDSLLNMDSATRRALFGQMQQQGMAVMKKINSLPPDQRAQFFRDLTGDKFDGTTPPTPGKGGPRNGRW